MERKKRKGTNRIRIGIYLCLWFLIAALNIVSRNSKAFSDAFRRVVFTPFGSAYARFSGLFSFSVGERLLILGVITTVLFLIAGSSLVIRGLVRRKTETVVEKTGVLSRFFAGYCRVYAWIFVVVALIMTCNCYILYHASSFRELYLPEKEGREYSIAELAALREYCIDRANELAPTLPRDDAGYLTVVDADELEHKAGEYMTKLGAEYSLLSGYYPDPKQFTFSDFFSQQYMAGYYFPFSMEANYNARMYISNVPATLCHELAHLKGFIYEDDASFIGYLACIDSGDPFFEYGGYLSVISYLNNDLYKSLGEDMELYSSYKQCSDLVKQDRIFLTEEAWKEVESHAVISTETLQKASDTFLDTNQKLNGIEEGIAVYGNVVQRLLEYYDGILY